MKKKKPEFPLPKADIKYYREVVAMRDRAIKKFQEQVDALRSENVMLADQNSEKLRRLGDSFQAWLNSIDFL